MRTFLVVWCACAGCCMAAMPSGLIGGAQAADELRVLSSLDWPPFTYLDQSGQPAGFEVEFANAICDVLQRPCQIINTPFEEIIPALLAGRGDVIVSQLVITEERKQEVAFTNPYTRAPPNFFVAKRGYDRPTTADGIKGQRIGVPAGSVQESYARENFPHSTIVPVPSGVDASGQNQVFAGLGNGDIDIALMPALVAWPVLASPPGKEFAVVGDPIYANTSVGMAVRKQDDALRKSLNAALVRIRLDGTYKKINDKYFPFDLSVPSGG